MARNSLRRQRTTTVRGLPPLPRAPFGPVVIHAETALELVRAHGDV